jgi:putative ABC transport system substrate-binding protein
VLLSTGTPPHTVFLRAVERAAATLGVAVATADLREASDVERAMTAFGSEPGTGLIVFPHPLTIAHRATIGALAARYRLPAMYPYRYFASDGGLISYGPDQVDQWRGAAGYVDRILRGAKAAELPVQAPVKYELAINLKTAHALGLAMPATLLARADDVIE